MRVLAIHIILQAGQADCLLITVDLPNAAWPFEGFQLVEIKAGEGLGLKYCEQNFLDIIPKITRL